MTALCKDSLKSHFHVQMMSELNEAVALTEWPQ